MREMYSQYLYLTKDLYPEYTKYSYNWTVEGQKAQLNNRQRSWADNSQKVHKWILGTWKCTQYHSSSDKLKLQWVNIALSTKWFKIKGWTTLNIHKVVEQLNSSVLLMAVNINWCALKKSGSSS